jgi:hypothetical protein
MLGTLAKSMLVGAVQKGTGVPQSGPISTTLLTTGVSLMLIRGRRPVGLALAVAGGLLRWHELEQERQSALAALRTQQPTSSPDASAATTQR